MPFVYNPFTDNLDNTRFSGSIGVATVTGTADRITISGTAEDPIVDIASTYVGQNTITTLGTVTTGVWNGSTVSVANGGTGKTTLTPVNGLLIANSTLGVGVTTVGTDGQVVIARTAGAPAFATITSTGSTIDFTLGANTLNMETGGTLATSYSTNSGSAVSSAGVLQVLGGDGISTSGAGNTLTINFIKIVGETITGNTGGALPPTGGNWNILTNNSTPVFAGSGSTLTLDFGLSNLNMGSSMPSLGTGVRNVGVGLNNLLSTIDGFDNIALGVLAGANIENGYQNVAIGNNALLAITDSIQNVAVGTGALQGMTASDGFNTCAGHFSLGSVASGIYNTALGYRAGANLASSNSSNICIGNRAVNGDSNRIRIGNQGSGDDQQDSCFIAGIVGVTVANAKSVTINSSTGELGVGTSSSIISWVDVTGTSDALEAGVGYVANNAGLVTLTLPASSTLGDTFKVITKGAGLCTIAQNASQSIRFAGSTTTSGVGGSLTATAVGDTLEIVSTADDEFYVVSSIGSWTVI